MSKALKQQMATTVEEDLGRSPDVLVVGFLAMNAAANFALRRNLREQGVRLRVIHNRCSRHALDERRKGLAPLFTGQTAIAVAERDEVDFIPVAKTLLEAGAKQNIVVRGGFVDGELLNEAGVKALAASPDKPTLRAMLLGAIQAPGRGIAASMNAVLSGLARCVKERVEKGGGVEGGEAA